MAGSNKHHLLVYLKLTTRTVKFAGKHFKKNFFNFCFFETNTVLCSPKLAVWVVGYSWDTSKEENIIFSSKTHKLKKFFPKTFFKNLFPPANLTLLCG